jgi:DNA-binding NarL/FixJ family response regulator
MSTTSSILIVDDHPVFRRGLRQVIEEHPRFRIAGEAADGRAALELASALKPDIAIADIDMPHASGLDLARGLRKAGLPARVVFLTMYQEEDMFNAALDLGVKAYVLKETAVDDILMALDKVTAGVYMGSGYDAGTANGQNLWVQPAYIADVVSLTDNALWSGNGNYGTLEDPAGGTRRAAVLLASPSGNGNSIHLRVSRASNLSFRLTLIFGGGDGGGKLSDVQNVTVTTTNAMGEFDTVATTHTGLPMVGVSYKQFDIPEGLDDLWIEINGGGDGDNTHLTGLAFDQGGGGGSAPVIGQQPEGGTFLVNVPLQLTVLASGGSLEYQWFKDNDPLEGATNDALSLAPLATTDAGSYSVVVSNSSGTVTSDPAVIAVETSLPQHLLDYQTALFDELSIISHYGFDDLTADDAAMIHPGTFSGNVRFGEGVGGGAAKTVLLSGSGHVNLGQTEDFDFADGSGSVELWLRAGWTASPGYNPCVLADRDGGAVNYSLHLQAGKSGLDFYNGARNSSIPIPPAGTDWHLLTVVFDGGAWTVYWDGDLAGTNAQAFGASPTSPTQIGSSSPAGAERWIGALDEVSFFSDPLGPTQVRAHYDAYFTGESPAITLQPVGTTVNEGDSYTLSVSATGGAPLSYQWFKDGDLILDATSNTLPLTGIGVDDGGSYTVEVSNPNGSALSDPAVLIVLPASTVTYAGTDTDTQESWRTAAVAKPLDADGDNVYGSDGWLIYAYSVSGYQSAYDPASTRASLPAYINDVTSPPRAWGGGDAANFGQIDDPLNPGSLRNSTHGLALNGSTLTLVISRASDQAFRLGVMLGNDGLGFDEDITVSAGASAMVRHQGPTGNLLAQYHFFDVGPGLAPVTVTVNNNSRDNPGLMGFTFDGFQPRLTYSFSNSQLVLSWTKTGYVLQENYDLSRPNDWMDVPG